MRIIRDSGHSISVCGPNEQELFWAGPFGNDYTDRDTVLSEERVPFFRAILNLAPGIGEICELGANKGYNLRALESVDRSLRLTGVELNTRAFENLSKQAGIEALHSSIREFSPDRSFDLVFTCGVLIHINPTDLPAIYRKIGALSRRYVLLNEYFSPTPVGIPYRGHRGKLFKRDFAGEFLDATEKQFGVVGYGFLWKRQEPAWDDTTWTLLRRLDPPK
jgi:pseudaminic acid biosynthesis-associated methylase